MRKHIFEFLPDPHRSELYWATQGKLWNEVITNCHRLPQLQARGSEETDKLRLTRTAEGEPMSGSLCASVRVRRENNIYSETLKSAHVEHEQ